MEERFILAYGFRDFTLGLDDAIVFRTMVRENLMVGSSSPHGG
jgi:hypothetical protein